MYKLITFCVLILALGGCHHFGVRGDILKHAKGDMVAISGRLTKAAWTARDGAERSGFSVCVDSIRKRAHGAAAEAQGTITR